MIHRKIKCLLHSGFVCLMLFYIWCNISWLSAAKPYWFWWKQGMKSHPPVLLWEPLVGIWLHCIFSPSLPPQENLSHSDVKLNGQILPLPLYHAYLEEGWWLGRNKFCAELLAQEPWNTYYTTLQHGRECGTLSPRNGKEVFKKHLRWEEERRRHSEFCAVGKCRKNGISLTLN